MLQGEPWAGTAYTETIAKGSQVHLALHTTTRFQTSGTTFEECGTSALCISLDKFLASRCALRLSRKITYEDRLSCDCSNLATALCPYSAASDSGVRPYLS